MAQDSQEITFKVKRTTEFRKIMSKWAETQRQSPESIRFMFDGTVRVLLAYLCFDARRPK